MPLEELERESAREQEGGRRRSRERGSTCVCLNVCLSPAATHKAQFPGLPAQPPWGGAPAGSPPSQCHVTLVGARWQVAWEGGGDELPVD